MSQDILTGASKHAETAKQEVLAKARKERDDILSGARVEAEAEASKSDTETDQLLASYQKAFQNRKNAAVERALELILRG